MILKKRYFTLVEILIVITIVAVIAGAFTINVRKAVIEQRYRTEVELAVDTLRLAQDLMLIIGADMHFIVEQAPNNSGIMIWLEADGELPEKWRYAVSRTRRTFTSIHTASFRDERPFPITQGRLDIRFQSQGSLMSRGVLRFSPYLEGSDEGPLKTAICLPGYPAPIIAQSEANQIITCGEDDTALNTRLTNLTQREILEDKPPEQATEKPADEKPQDEKPKPLPPK